MFKKYSRFFALALFCIFGISVTSASAIDLDEATRTVVADSSGTTVVLTPEQVKRGKRLFNATCGACHLGIKEKLRMNFCVWTLTRKISSVSFPMQSSNYVRKNSLTWMPLKLMTSKD